MQMLNELFQTSFPIDAVAECFVTRIRARGAAVIVAGSEPTTLSITLTDGRKLQASSRGPGPKQDAINSVVRWINEWKANQTLAALSNGHTVQFGTVELTPEGIENKGVLTRWNEISGWAVRRGGLVYDNAHGRLAGEVWLPRIPFGDALCLVVAHRLPDKNYETMPPGAGPKHGFFSVTARIHVPGTSKYARHVVVGAVPALIVLGALVLGVLSAWDWVARAMTPPPDPHGRVDEALAALQQPSTIAGRPTCSDSDPLFRAKLIPADKSNALVYQTNEWRTTTVDQLGYLRNFFVWSEEDGVVRVVEWDGIQEVAICVSHLPISDGETAEQTALRIIGGRIRRY